jgi:hypothetical protein
MTTLCGTNNIMWNIPTFSMSKSTSSTILDNKSTLNDEMLVYTVFICETECRLAHNNNNFFFIGYCGVEE